MGERRYHVIGVGYASLGIFFCVFFLFRPGIRFGLFSLWQFSLWRYLLGLLIISLVIVINSFNLAICGVILIVRGYSWLIQISVALSVYLLLTFYVAVFNPTLLAPIHTSLSG